MSDTIQVQVCYALPHRQEIVDLRLAMGATAREAVQVSGLLAKFPEIDLSTVRLGVYAKAITPDTVLHEHDRIEIYRPLIADPKEARRQRAFRNKG